MAVSNEDLARLIVTLDADVTKMYNGLKKAQQATNTAANSIERRLTQMSSNIDRTFANLGQRMSANLTGPLAGIGAAFSVREVIQYADAWTTAGNKVAAAGSIVGMQGRSLTQLRELADQGRSSFEDTIQLYSRLLRAAGDVAESEMDIARATNIVNKAFKAGGASTAEMQAGVIQLSQGLASGVLQGDELRSIRENAPVLAEVMARYFKTTIGGLKELGSQGKLTSDEVFKAILSGEREIEAAFGTTNRTIGEGIQLVQNRLIEYIGTADQTAGATSTITGALTALADNFNQVADVVLKLAAVIAGALIGRSILGMIGMVGQSIAVLRTLGAVIKAITSDSSKLGGALTAAFGPLALIVGGAAALAFQELSSQSIEAASNISAMNNRVAELGGATTETARSIREAAAALDVQTQATKDLAEAERQRNLAQAVASEDALRNGTFADNLKAVSPIGATANSDLTSALAIFNRAKDELGNIFGVSEADRLIFDEVARLAQGLRDATIPAQDVVDKIQEIQLKPMSQDALDLTDALDFVARSLDNVEFTKKVELDSSDIDELNSKLLEALRIQANLAGARGEIALQEELEALIVKLEDSSITAIETKAELDRLAGTSATFSNFIGGINALIGRLVVATEQALALRAIADGISGRTTLPGPVYDRGEVGRRMRARQEAEDTAQAYIDGQTAYNNLTLEERDLRAEIARIVKDSGQERRFFDEAELENLARANLAQKEADKEERSGGGGGGETDATRFYENLAEQEQANEMLAEELALKQQLDPLMNDYGYALEKARMQQELLNEAQNAGIAMSPELEARIESIAEAHAATTAAIERTEEAQEKLKESIKDWADFAKSATRGFIDDLLEGKSLAESFGNILNQLGSKLLDMGLASLFGGAGGMGGDLGFLGALFQPRANGGPVTAGRPYIVGETRPEIFVPNENGMIIPRIPNAATMNGSVSAPVAINIDARGADSEGLARLQAELVKMKAELPYAIKNEVSRRSKKGW